jgi:electron transport complex protein RnfC
MDVGAVVLNVSTAAAVSEALRTGRPLVERGVTVTGAVQSPKNVRARIGTAIGDLIDQCGGMKPGVNKIVLGGPMMGLSAFNLNTPVAKGTSGVLLIKEGARANEPISNCIRCASCVNHCPVGLMPLLLYRQSIRGLFDEAKAEHARDCIECGCCSFVCPARLPLVQSIRVVKREIIARGKRASGK